MSWLIRVRDGWQRAGKVLAIGRRTAGYGHFSAITWLAGWGIRLLERGWEWQACGWDMAGMRLGHGRHAAGARTWRSRDARLLQVLDYTGLIIP